MNINPINISFGSRYQVKGKDIDMNNPSHMYALGYAAAMDKSNSDSLLRKMQRNENLNKQDYTFSINDNEDIDFEVHMMFADLKYNILA